MACESLNSVGTQGDHEPEIVNAPSANEIMSHSGHATMKELVRYTKAADQARLARNALAKAVIR